MESACVSFDRKVDNENMVAFTMEYYSAVERNKIYNKMVGIGNINESNTGSERQSGHVLTL